jgi:hypothetical protein
MPAVGSLFLSAAGVATVDPKTREGSGSPEGVETAPVGAVYRRLDGTAGAVWYVKETGTGNTGWVAYGAPVAPGGATIKKVLVVVGDGAAQSQTATVTDAACTTTSSVQLSWGNVLPTDENDPECDDISMSVTPGTGSFVVRISAPDHRCTVRGAYRLAYQIG